MLLCLFSALLVVGTYSETCEAKGKKGSVKKKKAKKAKKGKKAKAEQEGDVSDNPYADGESEAADDSAEAADTAAAADEVAEGGEDAATEGQPEGASLASQIKGDQGSVRRSGRMEFDERLVKGQAAKSGAVYLFKRVPRRLPGLVPMRRSYRKRIVEPVLGQRELKAAVYSEEPVLVTEPEAEEPAEADKPAEEPAKQPSSDKPEEKKGD
jgi:hypothetical protein